MSELQHPPPRRALRLDIEKYQAYLDDTSIPEHQKEQMIEALWHIIVTVIDLRFEIAGAQAVAEENCGELQDSSAESTRNGLESANTLQQSGDTRGK